MVLKSVSRSRSIFYPILRRSFASMTENFAEVNGLRLNYAKNGSGSHNVLCLPGVLGSWRTDFRPQLEGLDANQFTTVAWDPPGYGSSRPPDRDFSKGFFARDAALAHGLMEKLGLCPYSVLGWSDGGNTGICLAHQQRKTDVLRKLVIWGTTSYVSDQEAKMCRCTYVDAPIIIERRSPSFQAIQDVNKWSPAMRQPMVDLYGEEYFEKTWNNYTQAFLGFHEEQQGNICRELLPEIKTKTLIIHGIKDPLASMQHPAYLSKKSIIPLFSTSRMLNIICICNTVPGSMQLRLNFCSKIRISTGHATDTICHSLRKEKNLL